MHRIYSFDIFDTILTRKTATPDGIFSLIQDILKTDQRYSGYDLFIRENYYTIRVNAERALRTSLMNSCEEIGLDEIYKFIGYYNHLSPIEQEELMNLEINIEISNSVAIEQNISKIKKLIEDGERVILISDTYFSRDTINTLLSKANPILNSVDKYLSSEIKLRKNTASLFKYILNVEGIKSIKSWKHFGNDIISDVLIPNMLGIITEQYTYPQMLEYEAAYLNQNKASSNAQLSIGLARNLRLKTNRTNFEELGLSFSGIIFYEYIKWLLKTATKNQIKHLYFIARDGYVLKLLADSIIGLSSYDIKTHYIYGSRYAWQIPSISDPDCFVNIRKDIGNKATLDTIAKYFHIEKDNLLCYLPKKYRNCIKIYSKKHIDIIFELLTSNQLFRTLVGANWDRKKQTIIKYISQEINLSTDSFAFVDLQGTGHTMHCLANIIAPIHNNPLRVFYMTQVKYMPYLNVIPYVFYFNQSDLQFNEVLCRSFDGHTIGYCVNQKIVEPIFDFKENLQLEKSGYHKYIEAIVEFVHAYEVMQKEPQLYTTNLSQWIYYSKYMMHRPDKKSLEIIANIPFSTYKVSNTHNNIFAPKISIIDIIKLSMGNRTLNVSLPYAQKRSGCIMKKLLFAIYMYYNNLSYVKIIITNLGLRKGLIVLYNMSHQDK